MFGVDGCLEADEDGALSDACAKTTITLSSTRTGAVSAEGSYPGMMYMDSHQLVFPCQRSIKAK